MNRARHQSLRLVAKAALLSASCLAIAVASATPSRAQATAPAPGATELPPAQNRRAAAQAAGERARNEPGRQTRATARRPAAQPRAAPPPPRRRSDPANTQDARTGTVGVYANSTSVATKTNTPLINIPQSVSC